MPSSQPQPLEKKAESATPILPDDMGLDEVVRVMDVAATLAGFES